MRIQSRCNITIFLARLFIFFFLATSHAKAKEVPASASSPLQSVTQGDAEYSLRKDFAHAKTALEHYEEAIRTNPTESEPRWKASRAAWWLGDQSQRRSDKLSYFQRGADHAKACVAQHPDSVECHFWLGGNLGSFGQAKGVLKSLALVKPIRHEMEEVSRINDRYQGGSGYRVLGVVDFQVPGFAGGDKKRALTLLNKALEIDSNNLFTLYDLTDYYKTVGDKEKKRETWDRFKALTPPDEFQPEYESLLKKGRILFEN